MKIQQFADDIIIYNRGRNTDILKQRIMAAIELIQENLNSIGLNLQKEKTEMIIFAKGKRNEQQETYRIGESLKEIKKEVKFLGIWLDGELNFRKQAEETRAKVKRVNNFMRYVMGVKWGVECNTSLVLYKNLVRASIEYGILIYYP